MSSLDIISLILSLIVAVIALITAYVSYLNFQVITRVTLYLYADTQSGSLDQNNYIHYPDRIKSTLLKNGVAIPPQYPMPIRWFDLSIGNTGPGVARILSWKINYNQNAKDKNDMSSNEPFYLGPQAKIIIAGYIPRDYSTDRFGNFFNQFTVLETEDGKIPWKITVVYEKQRRFNKHTKFGLEFDLDQNGKVKTVEL